ncbi:glycosyl transferase family 90-domain-containing protein [Lyophyllum atratum]|nr:glycosyl transferase family 90-domain-containing protein [Lyophyllum atratum]
MLPGLGSPRGRRFLLVPLLAFGFSLLFYCRQAIFKDAKSTEYVPLHSGASTPQGSAKSLLECTPPVSKPEKLLPHTYREDGILEVNPAGGHPIYELIERANSRWESKLSGASKTLDEAVREYVKRYNRRPPKGFDKWWRYVEEHKVQLPDEYDQIWRDLEPFWGYRPLDLQQLQSKQELHTDTYTFGKNVTGDLGVLKYSFAPSTNDWTPEALLGGAKSIKEILKDVQDDLPPFRAVISPHDNPTLFSDYEVKKAALDAADRGAYMDMEKLVRGPALGWPSGCSPTSPARQATKPNPPTKKTFIADHRKVMDPCLHPTLFDQIGEFLIHEKPGTSELMLPRFAYCATAMHHDIQIPTLSGWVDDILPRSHDPTWEHKLDERLNWRGSNTGMWHAPDTRWRMSQRTRLVDYTNGLNGTVKVLIPPLSKDKRVGEGTDIRRSKINPAMTDVAFAGEPVGCHEETCPELLRLYEWRKRQGGKESGNFKYIMDVDGNAWSSRFKRLITTNSLIFKATVYPEWFQDRIEPWVHYVPVQVDYSDLYDALAFFRGGLYGEGGHGDLAAKIAGDGRAWSRSFWRKEDVTAYVYRLVLEYARVMSSDRDAMSYDG